MLNLPRVGFIVFLVRVSAQLVRQQQTVYAFVKCFTLLENILHVYLTGGAVPVVRSNDKQKAVEMAPYKVPPVQLKVCSCS